MSLGVDELTQRPRALKCGCEFRRGSDSAKTRREPSRKVKVPESIHMLKTRGSFPHGEKTDTLSGGDWKDGNSAVDLFRNYQLSLGPRGAVLGGHWVKKAEELLCSHRSGEDWDSSVGHIPTWSHKTISRLGCHW
jgi:hypothetical protein